MPSELAPAERSLFNVSEAEIDQALAACDGDPRALLVGQAYRKRQISHLKADAKLTGLADAQVNMRAA